MRRCTVERVLEAGPFEDGTCVIDERDGQVGYVSHQTFRCGSRARLDEPGEPAGWDVEVVYDDGSRDEVDAGWLTALGDDDDEAAALTAGQKYEPETGS